MIATSTSFTQLVDRIELMHDVVRGDQRLMDGLHAERDAAARAEATLQAQRERQAALLLTQQREEAQLESSLATQQAALAYLDQLQAQYEDQMKQLEADKARLDSLVAALQAQYDEQARKLGGGSGRFAWPEQGPITQPFGCTDVYFEIPDSQCPFPHRFHSGIDIGDDYGNTITAGDTGIVAFTGGLGCYGNAVIISHGGGYTTLYGHLSSIAVGQGQAVSRGELIGREGSTGCSTGPHLHFEIRFNNVPQNPLSYLR
jgi:murein DD-endopeptidase MepM/ murein hydrolase activator NlpD